jgi:hypothetical protein
MIIARPLPIEGAASELARALRGRRNGHDWRAQEDLCRTGTEQISPTALASYGREAALLDRLAASPERRR